MTIQLTPDQEETVRKAVADGLAPSEEDFVSSALNRMRRELEEEAGIRRGLADMAEGRVIPHEDAMVRIHSAIGTGTKG
ncbi:MAG: hypothetical protein ACPGOY_04410 [Rhodospirillaceae bacterium]